MDVLDGIVLSNSAVVYELVGKKLARYKLHCTWEENLYCKYPNNLLQFMGTTQGLGIIHKM